MIIFDTETTGLPKANIVPLEKQPKIIEFAAIKLDDTTLEEVDRLEFLVNPQESISNIITKITNLKTSDLVNEKTFDHYYPELVDFFFKEKYLVAHNIAFDIKMLVFELARLKKQCAFPFPPVQICTVMQTMKLYGYRLNLTKLHHHLFGVNFEEAHRAMNDVEALARCTKELIKREIIKL